MDTYRLALIGQFDGQLYGIKEFEAKDAAQAECLARDLCQDRWGEQPLRVQLGPKLISIERGL